MPTQLDVGPLSVDKNGIKLKPQMMLGAEITSAKVELGVGDVRDGLRVAAKAQLHVCAYSEGHSKEELHSNIHCDTPGFHSALEVAKKILGWKKSGEASAGHDGVEPSNEMIAESLGMSYGDLERVLSGKVSKEKMTLNVQAEMGAGFSAEVRLGWCDTKGYNMVGVAGGASIGVDVSGKVFSGRHQSGQSMKVILGVMNFTFEYTFPLADGKDVTEGKDQAGRCNLCVVQ